MTDPKTMEAARRVIDWNQRAPGTAALNVTVTARLVDDAVTVARALLAGEGPVRGEEEDSCSAAGAGPFDQWQPISTAPKDGRDILLCGDPKRYGRPHWIDHWDDANECWFLCRYSKPPASIIAWRPLTVPAIENAAGEKAGLTQASDSRARPSSPPSPAVRDVTLSDAEKDAVKWLDKASIYAERFEAFEPHPPPQHLRTLKAMLAVRDGGLKDDQELDRIAKAINDAMPATVKRHYAFPLDELRKLARAALSHPSPPDGEGNQ